MVKGRLLFMEDEETIREVLTEYLRIAGYDVVQAEDGQVALDLLMQESFDLAILDIMVPKVTGLEVLAWLAANKPQMPAIMLTALSDEKTQVEAFNHMADDFIIKPVAPIILIKRVETILRRAHYANTRAAQVAPSGQPVVAKVGLMIDQPAYKAYYGERDLELTVSEFLILQTLMGHPGQVYTRDQLINAVFGEDYICSDRVIDTHMKNLRRKLPVNCIKTVIGLGYRYEASGGDLQ